MLLVAFKHSHYQKLNYISLQLNKLCKKQDNKYSKHHFLIILLHSHFICGLEFIYHCYYHYGKYCIMVLYVFSDFRLIV